MDDLKFEAQFPPATRQEEIGKIIQYVREGNFSEVIGLPGVGRSNLVGLLSHNKKLREFHLGKDEPYFHFIPVNFTEVRGKKSQDALRLIAISLIDSLRERGKDDIAGEAELLLSAKSDDELSLFHSLKRAIDLIVYEKKLRLIFLFDHFEEFVGNSGALFFPHLAALQEHARYSFMAVFFLHRPLAELVDEEMLGDVHRLFTGREVYLRRKDPVLDEFLIGHIEKLLQKKIDEKSRESLLELTGGHAKLLKICLEEWLGHIESEGHEGTLRMSKAVRSVSYEMWSAFHAKEQSLLRHIVMRRDKEADDTELSYLENIGLVEDFSVTIPLFNDFVRYRAEHKLDEQFVYKNETNTITKGDSVLNEVLTANEFSLLKFLLLHKGEVVNRDVVVQSIWGDLKSTAGVTDQAIDQLIFRLRQKVEDDPSDPKHITTLKGRGIKYSP